MKVLTVFDWQPSDCGPWLTQFDENDKPHVIPGFGPKHKRSMRCWCHPVIDADYTETAISHNVAH